jgi:hypothetical protein
VAFNTLETCPQGLGRRQALKLLSGELRLGIGYMGGERNVSATVSYQF